MRKSQNTQGLALAPAEVAVFIEARRIAREQIQVISDVACKDLTLEQRRALDRLCDLRNAVTELLALADEA